ncbi:hypothetical protein F4604DRAFT_1776650 [Suillus subluteus]|nr:hypothetical protein F4604DRAFT_1776650 [Suillus subluteus]
MSNRDQDTIIISARSYDKGWDFLKALMEGDPYAPYGRIESQPLDLPDDWKLPSQPFARFCSTQLYLITLGKPDLEELWRDVSQWNGVNKRVIRSDHPIADLFIVSSLFLVVLVHAACMSILQYSVDIADHLSRENYEALMNLSASFLLAYVLCQGLSRLNSDWMALQQFATFRKPGKIEVLICLALSRTAEFSFALSSGFLARCGFVLFTGADYWMSFAEACTFGLLLDAVLKRDVQTVIWRGVLTLFLWFGVALGYLQTSCDSH